MATQYDEVTKKDVDIPVKVEATYDYLKSTSDVIVKLEDDGYPRVIIDRGCSVNTQSPTPFIDYLFKDWDCVGNLKGKRKC